MPRPPSAFPTDHDPAFPSSSPHVAADPAALTAAAGRPPALPAMGAPTRGGAVPQILVRRPPRGAGGFAFVCWSGCW